MTKTLYWHWHYGKHRPCWWLAFRLQGPRAENEGSIGAAAILRPVRKPRRNPEYVVSLIVWRDDDNSDCTASIRCRDRREACDCARRWAEYQGHQVWARFPKYNWGKNHEH